MNTNSASSSPLDGPEDQFRTMEDIEREPPSAISRLTLYAVGALFIILLAWSIVGKLDIIATAQGRLVPQTFVKIVQPADGGIILSILVEEGQRVEAEQVLMRMDTRLSDADTQTIKTQLDLRVLQLRRIDAELSGKPMHRKIEDPGDLFAQVEAQYKAHRQNYLDNLGHEQEVLRKAEYDLASAKEVLGKLQQVTPILKQQAEAYAELGKEGYAGQLMVREKLREYLERQQDLKAQEATVASLETAISQSKKRIEVVTSNYRSQLQNEKIEAEGNYQKLQQDWIKQQHRARLLELKAPQAGVVKDLATHTQGTVVGSGTILLTLVPEDEPLVAEVQVKNDDVGFIHEGQPAKIKLVAYPFQKYGMLEGKVIQIGPDAQDGQSQAPKDAANRDKASPNLTYKALIQLGNQHLDAQEQKLKLVPGMQVIAEINQGQRTVMEYLLSPVQKAIHESARER